MEPQRPGPDRKNMDNCLRRLKQELFSMKEAGDGLHAQMNSMMGALQELKLLQVQTALDQLEISGRLRPLEQQISGIPRTKVPERPIPPDQQIPGRPVPLEQQISGIPMILDQQISRGSCPLDHQIFGRPNPVVQQSSGRASPLDQQVSGRSSPATPQAESRLFLTSSPLEGHSQPPLRLPRGQGARGAQHRGSLSTSPSFTSSEEDGSLPLARRYSQASTTSWGFPPSHCPISESSSEDPHRPPFHPARMAELQGMLDSLSREVPSMDSDFPQDDADDSSDWTSSLMSHSRNRQPLVLGDNFFADLVGNWLDLPELESPTSSGWEDGGEGGDWGEAAHPLRLSRSQEFCRRLSLTANIFKKVLRSVRPDRDKLLKERPGWMPAADVADAELFKRPKANKKVAKPKGTFYRPFWARASEPKVKGRPGPGPAEERCPTSGAHIGRGWSDTVEKQQPLFDYSSAIWV